MHTETSKGSLEVDVLGTSSCQRLIKHLHDNHQAMSSCMQTPKSLRDFGLDYILASRVTRSTHLQLLLGGSEGFVMRRHVSHPTIA